MDTENQRLKDRLMALEDSMRGSSSKYGTPDGASREDGSGDRQDCKEAGRPKEDGPRDQQALEEAGRPSKTAGSTGELITLAAAMKLAEATKENEEENEGSEFKTLAILYTILVA